MKSEYEDYLMFDNWRKDKDALDGLNGTFNQGEHDELVCLAVQWAAELLKEEVERVVGRQRQGQWIQQKLS